MKKNSTEVTMRRISGILYGVLFAYSLLFMKFVMEGAGFGNSSFAWGIEVILIAVAAVFAVWLLAKDYALSSAVRRAVPVASIMVIVFQLLTYGSQISSINYGLADLLSADISTAAPDYGIWSFVVLGGKLLLIILAAFFVTCAKEEEAGAAEEAADDTTEEVLEAEEKDEEAEKAEEK